jgi:hypothetical protein
MAKKLGKGTKIGNTGRNYGFRDETMKGKW